MLFRRGRSHTLGSFGLHSLGRAVGDFLIGLLLDRLADWLDDRLLNLGLDLRSWWGRSLRFGNPYRLLLHHLRSSDPRGRALLLRLLPLLRRQTRFALSLLCGLRLANSVLHGFPGDGFLHRRHNRNRSLRHSLLTLHFHRLRLLLFRRGRSHTLGSFGLHSLGRAVGDFLIGLLLDRLADWLDDRLLNLGLDLRSWWGRSLRFGNPYRLLLRNRLWRESRSSHRLALGNPLDGRFLDLRTDRLRSGLFNLSLRFRSRLWLNLGGRLRDLH